MSRFEQFLVDLDDWLIHRGGDNVFVSRRMAERSRFLPYWIDWLAKIRVEDGLPEHVQADPPKEAA